MDRYIIVGLGPGDEGKGTTIDYLTRKIKAAWVIRFNGGSQAAHNVVTPEGLHHTFAQFGSGMLVPGVRTYLSKHMLVDPIALFNENQALQQKGIGDGFQRLLVDEDCALITPFHRIINQMLEISRGQNRHSSCGMGVGQAMLDKKNLGQRAIFAKDLKADCLREKLQYVFLLKLDLAEQLAEQHSYSQEMQDLLAQLTQPEYVDNLIETYQQIIVAGLQIVPGSELVKILQSSDSVIFEGAQGTLLDAQFGFFPYVTKSSTTIANAQELHNSCVQHNSLVRLGVIRPYQTRHGNGPLVTEDQSLAEKIPDQHNGLNKWQGQFRIGWFDLVATRYALEVNGQLDALALTNLDRLNSLPIIKVCIAYEYIGARKDLLDKYFIWREIDGKVSISGLKKNPMPQSDEYAKLLFDCRPLEFKTFPGWEKDLQYIKTFADLPQEAKDLVNFLQSCQGLNVPIRIISKGQTWQDKIEI